ncbi:Hint domain-containing protein [Frigidibacter oleivorans]|uniref:Hint domain-containing protein n=1 Tax=Frigidibacter oleivorans TaxID=2487129 RepID=UPI000F8D2E96|nr:Hint domain-containing protein [Frigidibacter oleivorans]
MAWLATFTHRRGPRRLLPAAFPAEMARGSLCIEILSPGPVPRGHWLLGHNDPAAGWWIALDILADGGVRLATSRDGQDLSLTLSGWVDSVANRTRLTFSWDAAAGRSLLTLEDPATGAVRQSELAMALPVPGRALEGLFTAPLARRDGAAAWFAAASHVHCPGPCPGLAAGTRIDTPDGPLPVEALRPGMTVTTLDAGPQPVIWSGRMTAPASGMFTPLRLAAACFGCEDDLILAPHQRILLKGLDLEDATGRERALAELRHLVDEAAVRPDPQAPVMTWHGLMLAGHHLVLAGGLAVETLFAGSLARRPALAATTLFADLAAKGALPLHRRPCLPDLHGCEARALAAMRMRARGPLAA